ncbi:MAG: hypothetical protein C4543_06140 [Ignavibacteriales bacterium]|nr:MAG: hypothetical protein C4543_06140 [Ignavibacteriales bacterium]
MDELMNGWMNEGLRSLSYTKYAQSHTKRKIYSLDSRISGNDKLRVGHSVMWRALPPTLIQQRHPALA